MRNPTSEDNERSVNKQVENEFKLKERDLLDKSEKKSKIASVIAVCLTLVGIAIFVVAVASLPFINSPGTVALCYLSGAFGIIPMVLVLLIVARANFKKYRKRRQERKFEIPIEVTWSDNQVASRNERITERRDKDNAFIKAQNKTGKVFVILCTICCAVLPAGIIPVVFQFLAEGHNWHVLPVIVSSLFHGVSCFIAYRFAYNKIFYKMVSEMNNIDKNYEQ